MKNQKGYTLMELVIVLGGIATLIGACFLVYVLWHFVAKFW